jgi:hypothetical protein
MPHRFPFAARHNLLYKLFCSGFKNELKQIVDDDRRMIRETLFPIDARRGSCFSDAG